MSSIIDSNSKTYSKFTRSLFVLVGMLKKNANRLLKLELNINLTQYEILAMLNQKEVPQIAIAEALDISAAAVSKTVSSLKNDELIENTKRVGNSVIIGLTDKGRALLEKANDTLHNEFPDVLEGVFTTTELESIADKFYAVASTLS